jgi:predicted phosphohydrolase
MCEESRHKASLPPPESTTVPLLWITDPHLDRAPGAATDRFLMAVRSSRPEAVILTGDVSHAGRVVADLEQIADAAEAPVHHLLGNHDHYGGSVASVRDAVLALVARRPEIGWLPPAAVVPLPDGRALVGVDGWADGRHGDPATTPLVLNDDRLIAEVRAQPDRAGKLAVKRVLANADARRLATLLLRAIAAGADRIVVATHVPPFVEALAPGSRIAHPDWHPLLVCGATGTVLRRVATGNPKVTIEVLAGHTHRACRARILPNLGVTVGSARYGAPAIQEVRI